jgi:hypothetical protein
MVGRRFSASEIQVRAESNRQAGVSYVSTLQTSIVLPPQLSRGLLAASQEKSEDSIFVVCEL